MTELAKVAPKGVWLTSVKGTLSPTTQVEGGTAGATAALRGALATPAVELTGCAAFERQVPSYIDRLHLMTGVVDVAFSRSERLEKQATGAHGAAAGGGSSGDCRGSDSNAAKFDLVTYFKALPAQLAIPGTATATATPPAASTPGGTAPANQTAAATPGGTP
jgi:hypothetical protein